MVIEPNTDVLHRELSVITRVLTRVALALSIACCVIYAVPGEAGHTGRGSPGTGWIASTGMPRTAAHENADRARRPARRAENPGDQIELERIH
jgi:hypothetical protein